MSLHTLYKTDSVDYFNCVVCVKTNVIGSNTRDKDKLHTIKKIVGIGGQEAHQLTAQNFMLQDFWTGFEEYNYHDRT